VKEEAAVARREEAQVPWQMVRARAAAEVDPVRVDAPVVALRQSIPRPS